MNVVQFFKDNNLDPTVQVRESSDCYAESDTHILYIRLSKAVGDLNQEYLVMSRHAAEDLKEGKLKLAELDVTVNEDGLHGLIRPDTTKVVLSEKLF